MVLTFYFLLVATAALVNWYYLSNICTAIHSVLYAKTVHRSILSVFSALGGYISVVLGHASYRCLLISRPTTYVYQNLCLVAIVLMRLLKVSRSFKVMATYLSVLLNAVPFPFSLSLFHFSTISINTLFYHIAHKNFGN